jgi:hypothetical protein
MPSRIRFPWLPALGLIALGCSGVGDEPVAHVGDMPVPRAEVERYFALNLLPGDDGTLDASHLDRVKSRLLDALADEKRLLGEARRLDLEVSDSDVDAHCERMRHEPLAGPRLPERAERDIIRSRLLVQKLQQQVADRLPEPTADEVRAYIATSRGQLAADGRVRLRSLRFESPADAERAAVGIREGRTSFAETVQNHGAAGAQAALFLLAREELVRHRRREAGERLRDRLREQAPLRIDAQHLPFRYVPDA